MSSLRNLLMRAGALAFALSVLSTTNSFAQEPKPTPGAPAPTIDQTLKVPAVAPNYRAENVQMPELSRVGVDMEQQQPLSLHDALKLALENNKDIEIARQNVKVAEFDLLGARGAYDPRLSTQAFYERTKTPISSFLSGGAADGSVTQSDFTGTFHFEGLAPKGGTYRFDFSSLRLTSNNQFAALTSQYPTTMTLSYTQPLLRGLKTDNARRQIEILKKNLTLTDVQFRQKAIDTITNVQQAYWDLVFALRNLQVQRDAVHDARSQMEHNKRLVEEGQLAPIDVVAAEAQVTNFEQALFSALEEVSRAENNLKNMIAQNRQASIWNSAIIPSDSVDLTAPEISLPEAMKLALDNRLALQQSNLARDINQIDQSYFRDQTKPEVNLVGSYGAVGLAGAVRDATNPLTASSLELRDRVNRLSVISGLQPLPDLPSQSLTPSLVGGFGQSLDNLLLNRFNNFRVGVAVSLPLKNRTAEAQLGRSLVEEQRLTTQREQLEQGIQVEVRNALQLVRSAEARLRAAASNRTASEQQYESEKRKLDAGQSTVFLVLDRQSTLTTARGNELRAQTDLNKAIAELQRATGNALTVNSIVVRVH